LRITAVAILQHFSPSDVSIALDNGMSGAQIESLLRVQTGMNAAEDDPSTLFSGDPSHLIPAQGIACVDSDSHNVAGLNASRIDLIESFVNDVRIAEGAWSGSREHIQPSRGDYRSSKRNVARVYEMNSQLQILSVS
jgi:hypothetical protein